MADQYAIGEIRRRLGDLVSLAGVLARAGGGTGTSAAGVARLYAEVAQLAAVLDGSPTPPARAAVPVTPAAVAPGSPAPARRGSGWETAVSGSAVASEYWVG